MPSYGNLRTLLLKTYIGAKCSPFAELVEPVVNDERTEIAVNGGKKFSFKSLKTENFSVLSKKKFSGVANSIKDLILCIVSVQAELYLVSPQFMNQVMSFVVRNCSEQLLLADKKLDAAKIPTSRATQVSRKFYRKFLKEISNFFFFRSFWIYRRLKNLSVIILATIQSELV